MTGGIKRPVLIISGRVEAPIKRQKVAIIVGKRGPQWNRHVPWERGTLDHTRHNSGNLPVSVLPDADYTADHHLPPSFRTSVFPMLNMGSKRSQRAKIENNVTSPIISWVWRFFRSISSMKSNLSWVLGFTLRPLINLVESS